MEWLPPSRELPLYDAAAKLVEVGSVELEPTASFVLVIIYQLKRPTPFSSCKITGYIRFVAPTGWTTQQSLPDMPFNAMLAPIRHPPSLHFYVVLFSEAIPLSCFIGIEGWSRVPPSARRGQNVRSDGIHSLFRQFQADDE